MSTTLSDPPHRRPIHSRNSAWARMMSSYLVRRRVSPNTVSVLGMAAGICAGGALFLTRFDWVATPYLWISAAALILLRLLANMLDGMVAIEAGRSTRIGDFLNDWLDRISDVAVLVGAGYAAGGSAELGLAAACVALLVAYVRTAGKSAGAPSDFGGPMAKQQRMYLIAVASLLTGIAHTLSFDRLVNWGPGGQWDLIAAVLTVVAVGGVFTVARRWFGIAANLKRIDSDQRCE